MVSEVVANWLTIGTVSALMAQIFGIVGLLWMVIFSCCYRNSVSSTKLIGSALVLGMAFAANHVVTYALSIFIVATLVTELHFLEKIAALLWNRDKYWDHLQRQSPAAVREKAEEAAREIQQNPVADGDFIPDKSKENDGGKIAVSNLKAQEHSTKNLTEIVLDTEEKVLNGLVEGGGAFEGGKLLKNYAIRYGARFVRFDAIILFSDTHYVVELKHGNNVASANKTISNVKKSAEIYRSVLDHQGESVRVLPVVILPGDIDRGGIDTSSAILYTFDREDFKVKRWSDGA